MVKQILSFAKFLQVSTFKKIMVGQGGIGNGMSFMKLIERSILWCINPCKNVVLNLLNHRFSSNEWRNASCIVSLYLWTSFFAHGLGHPQILSYVFLSRLSRLCANKKVSLSWLFLGVLWKQSKSAVHKVGEVNHVLLFAFLRRFLYWSEANI